MNETIKKVNPKDRAIVEINELEDKYYQLDEFLSSPNNPNNTLNPAQIALMCEQRKVMREYIDILRARLTIWEIR